MRLEFTINNGRFEMSDAIELPDDHAFTDKEVEAMKQTRFDAWLLLITSPQEE